MQHHLRWSIAAAAMLATTSAGMAKPTPMRVALRATAPANVGRHITAAPKGGLILGSKVLGNKEVFTIVDINGGTLQDGDQVQIQYGAGAGNRPSYWRENKGAVARTAGRPDSAATFRVKWKQKNKSLMLRTASGKYVSGPGKGKALVTTSKQNDPTTVFDVIRNPSPKKTTSAGKSPAARKAPSSR